MGRITKFVAKGNTYTFPTEVGDQEYHDNFKEVVARATRLPGADGGVDEYGSGRAPSAIGNIQFGVVLLSDTREGMQTLRDTLAQMKEWGVGQLYFQPTDSNATPRWANCRVNNIDMPEERHKHTDLEQPVKLSFQASDPFWYTAGNQKLYDSTYSWDSTINWDEGSFSTITGSGSLTVTPSGSATTLGRFVAKVTGALSFNQLVVQRIVNSQVSDQMILQMLLNQNDVLELDPRRQWVTVNGVDRIANFDVLFPDWLRLLPGSNTIKVTLDEPTAAISATVFYYDRYS